MKQCKYDRWRELPAGRELDQIVQREAIVYPKRKVVPKWSTDPRLTASLISNVAGHTNAHLMLYLSPEPTGEHNAIHPEGPVIRQTWLARYIVPKGPAVRDEYEQEGTGDTLNLALCRALLHIQCDCDGPECQETGHDA